MDTSSDTAKHLKVDQERFRLWIENIADVIILFSEDGTILYVSASIQRVLGWSAEERIGQNVLIASIAHPDDRVLQRNFIRDVIAKPEQECTSIFRLRHKDGSYRYIEAIGRNLLHNPLVEGIVTTYRDITERIEIEQRKDWFIRAANHELRTPLTNMKGYTQVLKMVLENCEMPEAKECADVIDKQVDHLTRLISDFTDATRVQTGMMTYKDEMFAIDELISDVVCVFQQIYSSHTIEAQTETQVQLCGDRVRIRQVLSNLLINAMKYAATGTKITIKTELVDEQVRVSVQDKGMGIAPEYHRKIFERFYRLKSLQQENTSGLGIGLYLAQAIVERHQGRIWVESEEGKGATFIFTIPCERV